MSSINLQSLRTKQVKEYTYKDVHLDLKENSNISEFGLHREANTTDIEESRDGTAIKNSLTNIFNTTPGEKLLNPVFGANLKRYLFDPLTKDTAEQIGLEVKVAVETFEPRVTLLKIIVVPIIDQNQYDVTLILKIPTLNNKRAVLSGRLTTNGYEIT